MPEADYTNREIQAMFSEVRDTLNRIEVQTVKTNGRVTANERWRYIAMGWLGAISLFLVPILGWALFKLVNLDSTIHQAVDDALSAYDISNGNNEKKNNN